MSTDSIVVSGRIPATAAQIYDAFLDGALHAAMTGAPATGSAQVGAPFTAWDDYISGKNLSLERPHRIVQAWRSTQFPKGAPDSHLEIVLEPGEGFTTVTFHHSQIPAGQGKNYEGGWDKHYLAPMRAFFSR